jgi:CubicO group peptidase (beta-lactamase class C family)
LKRAESRRWLARLASIGNEERKQAMKSKKNFTAHQIGALITMAIVAIWGIGVSWLHMTRPLGIAYMEILFMSAIVPICLILMPLYALRVRWSYISGIIVLLAFFAGLIKTVVGHTFVLSLSAYNLTTVVVLLSAGACIYFSLRSYLELSPVGWIKSALGIGCLLAISAVAIWQVSSHEMQIENYNRKLAVRGVQTRTGDIDQLDEKIEAMMDEGDVPSLAAAIVVNGEIVWIRGYGEQDTLDQMHDIASMTKPFVATAVMQLYEQGLIGLDDDVNQYLPFNVRHPDYPDSPITIHMLLSNRSCLAHNTDQYRAYIMGDELGPWWMGIAGLEYSEEVGALSYAEFMADYLDPDGAYFQPEVWANCKPGSQFVYSTPGFDLLGYLVEQVSGQPFNDYLQENIFAPLRMTSTTATPLDHPERMAIPYERYYGVLAKTNVQLLLSQRRRIGGGGLYSTVADLANFLLAHMNLGEFEGHQLLQPDALALMHEPIRSSGGDFMQRAYGHGWAILAEEPQQMWDITFQPRGSQGHGGGYFGYGGAMFMVEEEQGAYGYVLLTNTNDVVEGDWPWNFAIQLNIQDLILGEAYRMYQDSLNQ